MLVMTPGGSTNREIPPAGTHVARCHLLADVGTQTRAFEGQQRQRRELVIGWRYADPERDGVTHEITRTFTASIAPKSTLRTFLEAWRGRAFADGESFDLRAILGKACLLSVAHVQRPDKAFAKVTAASALPRGMQAPALDVEPLAFDMDDPQTWGALDKLPRFIREAIERSPEWHERANADPYPADTTDEDVL